MVVKFFLGVICVCEAAFIVFADYGDVCHEIAVFHVVAECDADFFWVFRCEGCDFLPGVWGLD